MANIVNVLLTDTFSNWRDKNNEIGDAIGDLDLLNQAGETGEDDIISTLNNLRTETTNNLGWIGNIPSLHSTHTDLVSASNANKSDIDTMALAGGIDLINGGLSGYNGPEVAAVDIFNNHLAGIEANEADIVTLTSDLNTAESDIVNIQGDIGDFSTYAGTQSDIVSALNDIKTHMDEDPAEYVNVTGDTMTGTLVADGGISATTTLELGVGSGTAITVDNQQRLGIGVAPNTSYKVNINGALNATSLYYNGEDLDTRYIQNVGGTDVEIDSNLTISGDLVIGSETVFDSSNTFSETVQDIVGAMTTGNTENNITVDYQDTDGTLDFNVADNGHNHIHSNVTDWDEAVQDTVGDMVSGNSESGISVEYNDTTGKLNFNVNDPTISLSGDITGSATITNLGSTTINASLDNNAVESVIDGHVDQAYVEALVSAGFVQGHIDQAHIQAYVHAIVGAMVSGNSETNVDVTYDSVNNKLDFENTLQVFDASGSRLF